MAVHDMPGGGGSFGSSFLGMGANNLSEESVCLGRLGVGENYAN